MKSRKQISGVCFAFLAFWGAGCELNWDTNLDYYGKLTAGKFPAQLAIVSSNHGQDQNQDPVAVEGPVSGLPSTEIETLNTTSETGALNGAEIPTKTSLFRIQFQEVPHHAKDSRLRGAAKRFGRLFSPCIPGEGSNCLNPGNRNNLDEPGNSNNPGNLVNSPAPSNLDPPNNTDASNNRKHRKRDYFVQMVDSDGKILFEFSILKPSSKGFWMRIPSLQVDPSDLTEEPFYLYKERKVLRRNFAISDCYTTSKSSSHLITACLGKEDFSLSSRTQKGKMEFEVKGGAFNREDFVLEKPRAYDIFEAVQIAMDKNFSSQFQYSHMMSASHLALAAKLQLLPHFRMYDAIALIFDSSPGIANSFADWFGFLLPNNWMKAAAADSQAEAERVYLSILQANIAESTHMISYAMIHDQAKLNITRSIADKLNATIQEISRLQTEGRIPVFSLDPLIDYRTILDIEIARKRSQLGVDQAAIAQSMGLINPLGVEEILAEPDDTKKHHKNPDDQTLAEIAVDNRHLRHSEVYFSHISHGVQLSFQDIALLANAESLEQKRIYYTKQALKFNKAALNLEFLNPTGSPDRALGFNLIAQTKSMDDDLAGLELGSLQCMQEISQRVERAVHSNNSAILEHKKTKISHKQMEESLARVWARFEALDDSPGSDLRGQIMVNELYLTYEKLLEVSLRIEELDEKWHYAQVQLQRLLLSGIYFQRRDPGPAM